MNRWIKRGIIGIFIYFSILVVINFGKRIYHSLQYGNNSYYSYYKNTEISQTKIEEEDDSSNENSDKEYTTVIDHTTKYTNQHISTKEDAINLIEKDSEKEEKKCSNNLSNIYKEIRKKTKIYGINLCELSEEKVKELSNGINYVYDNYPFISEYVTNLTLVNDGGTSSYIAAFKPAFTFATSDTNNKFPFVIKIQVFLNAGYYLNDKYFQLVLENAKESNHFPKGTTETSLVVHEFGHVITYILAIYDNNSINTLLVPYNDFSKYSTTLKNYTSSTFAQKIISEAYNNYTTKYKKITEEEFRLGISGYANSTDENGETIYNETIAEAFHDYYIHQDSASKMSLEVIAVLNNYITKLIK